MLDSVGGVATEGGASNEAEAVFGSVVALAGDAFSLPQLLHFGLSNVFGSPHERQYHVVGSSSSIFSAIICFPSAFLLSNSSLSLRFASSYKSLPTVPFAHRLGADDLASDACVAGAAGAFDVSAAVDAAGTVEGGLAGFASAARAPDSWSAREMERPIGGAADDADVGGAVDAAGAVESVDSAGTHCHLPERTHARS